MIQCWRLDDTRQTLVLGSQNGHLAEVIYWGGRLPDNENLEILYAACAGDVSGGMLDENPPLSICPQARQTFPGQPGMIAYNADRTPLMPKFTLHSAESDENRIVLEYSDTRFGLKFEVRFQIEAASHVIEASTRLNSAMPIYVYWLSAPVFPAPQQSEWMMDFSGRWCGEFQINRIAWSAGMRMRENRTGRTGHEHFPGLIVPCREATNTSGQAYAFHYGWSGGHRMIAEELPDGRRQIQFGHTSGSQDTLGQCFETAKLYGVYSDAGINGCAIAFQRHVRDHIVNWPQVGRTRALHYNCWEAVYFDHKLPELMEIATKAAELGAERFVLDDGWFENRDNDRRALSDWVVDQRKYPDGLYPLIDHVRSLGMSFGLWFEPEMISLDSQTYKAFPHWVLGDEDQITGRHQHVLDMSMPEVRIHLFDRLSDILKTHDIDYIKWDHNRVLPRPDAAQTYGTYTLIDNLRTAFPHVEIESCASGGGRIDFGMLKRSRRVWLSDSNDALERLRIQHNAALFLPMAVTGSHVGPGIAHTSGRMLDIGFRAWVAAQRHMGFEMDPRTLTDREKKVLQRIANWWKSNREWMFHADILRLESIDPSLIAEQQLARDGSRFVVFAGCSDTSTQILPRPLPMTCLEPNACYRIKLVNRDELSDLSRSGSFLRTQDMTISGRYLIDHGLTLPWSFPERMWVIEGTRICEKKV